MVTARRRREAFSDDGMDGMDGMDNGMDADTDAAQAGGAGRIAPMLVIAALVGAGVGVVVWKRKKKKIGEEKALEDELEEELDNELGEPEMTTADVSEDETKDVEKEQNDHPKRKKK